VLVAVTGFADYGHRGQAFASGYRHFVAKPFDLGEIREASTRV
jgi:hypothetical protein